MNEEKSVVVTGGGALSRTLLAALTMAGISASAGIGAGAVAPLQRREARKMTDADFDALAAAEAKRQRKAARSNCARIETSPEAELARKQAELAKLLEKAPKLPYGVMVAPMASEKLSEHVPAGPMGILAGMQVAVDPTLSGNQTQFYPTREAFAERLLQIEQARHAG